MPGETNHRECRSPDGSLDRIERFVYTRPSSLWGAVMTSRYRTPLAWPRWSRAAWAAAPLAALLLAAACGDDGAEAASDTTTSTAASESEPTDDEGRLDEVVDALYAANAAVCEALGPPTPDPDHPALTATSTGAVLEARRERAEEFVAEGLGFHCPDDSRYEIEVLLFEFGEVEDTETVWLDVCAVDDSERVVLETGEVVGGGLTAVHSSDVLQRVDGQWKLEGRRINEQWEGEEQCDID